MIPLQYCIMQNESESWITSSILEILIVRKHEMKQKPYSNDVCHGIMRPRLPEPALLSTADTQSSSDLESPEWQINMWWCEAIMESWVMTCQLSGQALADCDYHC